MNSLRISSPRNAAGAAGVNGCCHGWNGVVQPNSKHVIRHPRIFLVLWGHFYETDADLLTFSYALVRDLISGPFMNELCQYGVAAGTMAGAGIIDTNDLNPAPATLDGAGVKTQLKSWFGDIIPTPAVNEDSLMYFILPPLSTKLTLKQNGTVLNGDVDFCGYHSWDTFNAKSTQPDTFFGIVSTASASAGKPKALDFVNALASCVSHEIAECVTNRDGQGFISTACTNSDKSTTTCEIGDICETQAGYAYKGGSGQSWPNIQRYWSGWDSACVQGANPVSVRKFLDAIGFDYHTKGLSALGASRLNIPYIASRVF